MGLSRQFVRLILKVVKQEVIHLVIDDTLTLRASKKAPGSQIHHQHGNKPNLAQYVRGQCWVSLAWVIRREKQPVALPLLTRLVPGISNTGKRVAAKTLIRAVYRLLDGRKVRVLVDSWYMRRIFIESMLARGFDVIGQVRIDTRLYDEPPKRKKGQRGRPRKYGRKYTPKRIAHLKRSMVTLPLYGKEQEVRYRSKVLMAHFLGGRLVRVVWCEFKSESGHWKKAHLLLSTDAKLTPEQIIEAYGERWSIESKCVFGLVIDFGTSQSPKSTRPLTTYLCPSRPGHQALRNNFASSLLLRTWLPMTGRRVRRPTLFSLWRKARRENSAASRLLGSTSLRFALHGWQRVQEPVFRLLGEADNIHLIEPLDYLPFVYLMQQSYLVLTDSGGVQEEAPSLGKPVLVMRSTTERPEALDAGTVELVGTDTNSIVSAISDLLDQKASYEKMAFSHNPYGDGNASTRISKALSPINQPMSAVSYLNP